MSMSRLIWIALALAVAGAFVRMLLVTSMDDGLDDVQIAAVRAASSAPDPADPRHERSISLLGAEWCGFCRQLEAEFDAKGVKYSLIDIDTEAGDRAMKALGARAVPVLVVGRTAIEGYDEDRTRELLGRLGYRVF